MGRDCFCSRIYHQEEDSNEITILTFDIRSAVRLSDSNVKQINIYYTTLQSSSKEENLGICIFLNIIYNLIINGTSVLRGVAGLELYSDRNGR